MRNVKFFTFTGGNGGKRQRFTPFPPYCCESLPLSRLPNISRCENYNPALVALRLVRAQLSSDL